MKMASVVLRISRLSRAFRIFRALAAAALALPLLPATAALAGEAEATFSTTEQSAVVQAAVAALREGNLERFAAQLDDEGRARLASPDKVRALRERIERRVARIEDLNFRTHLASRLRPDTHLGWVSNRVYLVDVHGADARGEPLMRVSVHCVGISLLDSFGATNKECRISKISDRALDSGTDNLAAGQAGVTSSGSLKQLAEDHSGAESSTDGTDTMPSATRAITR